MEHWAKMGQLDWIQFFIPSNKKSLSLCKFFSHHFAIFQT